MSADALVLQCVSKHNRPFNTQLVADLLATKGVKKPQCQRSLDALAASGKIRVKEFGKSKIYYPCRDTDVLSSEELSAKRSRCNALSNEVATKKAALDSAKKELAAIQGALTIDELQRTLKGLQQKAQDLEAQVAPLRSGKQTVSAEDNEALTKVFESYMDAWQRRRRMFNDIWSTIAEGVDCKESAVFEEAGVDTDSAMNVSYCDFQHLLSKRRR